MNSAPSSKNIDKKFVKHIFEKRTNACHCREIVVDNSNVAESTFENVKRTSEIGRVNSESFSVSNLSYFRTKILKIIMTGFRDFSVILKIPKINL